MININQAWPEQAVDAVNFYASASDLQIQGTDENVVRLEGRIDGKHEQAIKLDAASRRLKVSLPHDRGSEFTLKLPLSKAWLVEIVGGRSNIRARNILADLHITVGKGELQIEDLRGRLSVTSGNSDVRVNHFVQVAVPEQAPHPAEAPPEPAGGGSRDWLHWSDSEWEDWGENLGEKITGWAVGITRFVGPRIDNRNAALSICTGKGNAELADIEAGTGMIKLLRGDLTLQNVRVAALEMYLSRGKYQWEVAGAGR